MFETESSSSILVYSRKKLHGASISKLSTASTTYETQSSSPILVYSRKKLRGTSMSKLSTVSTTCETDSSSPVLVYSRKKQRGTSVSRLSAVSTMSESSAPNFVYHRRKPQGNSVAAFSVQIPADQKKNGDSVSVISSDANEQHVGSLVVRGNESVCVFNRRTRILKSPPVNGCSVLKEHASKNNQQNILDVDSLNDSCSSSKSNIELASSSKQTEVDNPSECSSSSATAVEIAGEYPSEKDFCIFVLRSQGQLEDVCPVTMTTDFAEESGNDVGGSCLLSCKICGHSESMKNMLICDNCEEAFHVSCCNFRKKNAVVDEWLCHSCLKKKHLNSPSITSEKGRKNKSASSMHESNSISLMLRYAEPYTIGVRVGKRFQADVPDWSCPVVTDDVIHEPLQMEPSQCVNFHEFNRSKPSKLSFIGNWLQCREITDSTESGANETICGKWRRAPLFAVQTDDWECFCSVFWDPSRADCAVPQELETDEVLKQLKYIDKVRPSLAAKRQKMVSIKTCSSKPVNNTKSKQYEESAVTPAADG